ncbi:M14 family metallopeptidase [Hydrogenophaga sp. RWCD_12]|uniref:M14 family metallopeptidase n=1 Tax=Hydrogenophaga sp. RWCD_12 TaxID=3391190 RepID=UPI00398510E0
MINPQLAFAPSYARARVQFLEGAAAAGMAIRSHNHPLPGRDGETLAMDVALDGDPDAERLLIVSSACHGVEGFCGSGIQVFATHDADWRAHAKAAGVAVLYIHALNPHGFSHLRRVTEDNVDLNRNFQDFTKPLAANQPYEELHPFLLPQAWPPGAENEAVIAHYIGRNGLGAYQTAVSQGQHSHPDGMFFGGTAPTWSHRTLREVLRQHGGKARHLAWIDLHTGLGPSGLGERIFACRDDEQALQRARAWWGGDGQTPVTSIYDGSSTSARLTGLMWTAIYEECPQAAYTGIALEYGTLPLLDVLNALRGDHWVRLHPEAPAGLQAVIRKRVKDAFYVDTDDWRAQVVSQARQAMFQAVDGLRRST